MITDKYPIKKVATLEFLPTAVIFNDHFGKYLKAPEPGVYLGYELTPRMEVGKVYRQKIVQDTTSGEHKTVEININALDADILEGAVYSEDGVCVIPERMLHLVSNQPKIPVVAIKLIHALLGVALTDLQKWPRYQQGLFQSGDEYMWMMNNINQDTRLKIATEMTSHLRRPGVVFSPLELLDERLNDEDIIIDLFEEMLKLISPLRRKMSSFVGNDVWSVHFLELFGANALQITKSVDYRIIDWHEKNNVPLDY